MNNKKLENLIKSIFCKYGLTINHAKICAKALINAELVGAPSHGLSRLKMYCDRIKKKVINSKPKIKIKKISQSITHIDGNNSIGFVVADIGIKQAIKSAKKTRSPPGKILNYMKNLSRLLAPSNQLLHCMQRR